MRTDPRYSRVKAMILDEATPRDNSGRLAFCHFCQRAVYFAGGTIKLLAEDLEMAATAKIIENGRRKTATE